MPDWLQWLLGGVFTPITTGLSAIKDLNTPVFNQVWNWMNDSQTGAASGILPTAGAGDALGPTPNADIFSPGNDLSGVQIPQTTTVEGDGGLENVDTSLKDALEGDPSLSQYVRENPGLGPEDYLSHMAQYSDEWAEKFVDYYLDKQSIAEANNYTAEREDTAYQRLVEDLRKAGLNPAMMYGSSASTSASGSIGAASPSGGANSASIGNYAKLKKLIIAYMISQMSFAANLTNGVGKAMTSLIGLL